MDIKNILYILVSVWIQTQLHTRSLKPLHRDNEPVLGGINGVVSSKGFVTPGALDSVSPWSPPFMARSQQDQSSVRPPWPPT